MLWRIKNLFPIEIKSIGFKFPDFQESDWPEGAAMGMFWDQLLVTLGSFILGEGFLFIERLWQFRVLWILFWIWPLLGYWLLCYKFWWKFKEAEHGK